jgi:PAS domain-containing protein
MNHNLFLQKNTQQTAFPSRGLLEYAHFGYMWTTVRTNKIVASHTVYEMLEIEPFSEFLTEQTWRAHVHKQDLYKLLQAEEKLLTDKLPCSAEYRMITKNGKHIFVNHHMQLATNHDGEIKILSILDDTTEQKHAEVILEVMNECFFELDKHYQFIRINAKSERFWNIRRDDVIGKNIWDVFPRAKHTEFYELIIKAVDERATVIQTVV